MSDVQLTGPQRTALDFAARDLADARTADLVTLPAPSLILLVERLRGRLDEMIAVVEELADL
ncbi:hypothetical protein [Streptomyces sp. NPDC048332]|uniref:hypothetical protein n=1 Tax=Streptomyces sp. NPDC048332 TaxID=3154619 RepID=UPI003415774B